MLIYQHRAFFLKQNGRFTGLFVFKLNAGSFEKNNLFGVHYFPPQYKSGNLNTSLEETGIIKIHIRLMFLCLICGEALPERIGIQVLIPLFFRLLALREIIWRVKKKQSISGAARLLPHLPRYI